MKADLPIRCTCGTLRGVIRDVSTASSNHVVCCCRGCQKYARELGCDSEVLDENGGSHIFQISPARVSFTEGEEHLACVQLTEKGAARWFASCCHTPILNTMKTPGTPFAGVLIRCVDQEALAHPIEAYIGPVRVTVNRRFPPDVAKQLRATKLALFGMLLRFAPMILWWRLRGDHKRNPFFDGKTGALTRPLLRSIER